MSELCSCGDSLTFNLLPKEIHGHAGQQFYPILFLSYLRINPA
ncbi:MAG: hypothetical protein ACFE9R_08960 [Candidatus Hermodarchaeota archaeon]